MPTPSSNPPPEQASSRSHTSTCPEEPWSWREPVAYAHQHSRDHGMVMHVDRESDPGSPHPDPVGRSSTPSSSSPSSDELLEEDAGTTATMRSGSGSGSGSGHRSGLRSDTASPRPESQSSATPASTTTNALTAETEAETEMDVEADDEQLHHKPMETEGAVAVAPTDDVEMSSALRSRETHHQQSPVLPLSSSSSSTALSQQQQHVLAQQRGQHSHDTGYNMSRHNHKADGGGPVQDGFWDDGSHTPSMGYEYSNVRVLPTSPSSFLRPGSRFHGTQQSERQVYDVQVEIKYVDFRESFLCGYLKIQGLTEDNPTLTTYFEGEIIGSKYGFLTQHPDWGATDKIDMNHWSKFTAFRQYKPALRAALSSHSHPKPDRTSSSSQPASSSSSTTSSAGNVSIPMGDAAQRENIFMRWKEHFLVPDHRVKTINGASFEGFYYICFNQKKGEVKGIYFHSKSEKFQQLDLTHVEDRGCFSAMEFR